MTDCAKVIPASFTDIPGRDSNPYDLPLKRRCLLDVSLPRQTFRKWEGLKVTVRGQYRPDTSQETLHERCDRHPIDYYELGKVLGMCMGFLGGFGLLVLWAEIGFRNGYPEWTLIPVAAVVLAAWLLCMFGGMALGRLYQKSCHRKTLERILNLHGCETDEIADGVRQMEKVAAGSLLDVRSVPIESVYLCIAHDRPEVRALAENVARTIPRGMEQRAFRLYTERDSGIALRWLRETAAWSPAKRCRPFSLEWSRLLRAYEWNLNPE